MLFGLWAYYVEVPKLQAAVDVGEQLLSLSHTTQDDALAAEAHFTLGFDFLFLGDLGVALDHLEQGIALDEAQQDRSLAARYGFDPRVPCRAFRAYTLSLLGYPDRAFQQREDALTLAEELSHPYTAAIARYAATAISQFYGDAQDTQVRAEALMQLSIEQKFTIFLAWGTILRGWALSDQGEREEGMAQIRKGMAMCRAGGTELRWPYWLAITSKPFLR